MSAEKVFKKIRIYLRLVRVRTVFATFIQMPLGFFLVKKGFEGRDLTVLLQYFVIIGIFLYGGLYTFNNIVDYANDRLSKLKTRRPLAKDQVSLTSAWLIFSAHMILVGWSLIVYRFPPLLLGAVLALAAINIFYTTIGKKIPYIEIITASTTYPARTAIGILLAGGALSAFIPFLAVNYLATITLNVIKRMGEKEFDHGEVRPVLKKYPGKTLGVIAIASCGTTVALIPLLRGDGWQIFFGVLLALLQFFFLTIYLISSRGVSVGLNPVDFIGELLGGSAPCYESQKVLGKLIGVLIPEKGVEIVVVYQSISSA